MVGTAGPARNLKKSVDDSKRFDYQAFMNHDLSHHTMPPELRQVANTVIFLGKLQ
jgi:hypothetical protein